MFYRNKAAIYLAEGNTDMAQESAEKGLAQLSLNYLIGEIEAETARLQQLIDSAKADIGINAKT